jgi:organic hydroperoxide reductase OsmC/OhrA
MHPYPHTYQASASAAATGWVTVSSPQLPDLQTAPPPEFGGPGGVWSPETLLCASLSDCFILTFRALARMARFEWRGLECRIEGTLDRTGTGARFVRFTTTAKLTLPAGADAAKAHSLLEHAEQGCLIANSLTGERHLVAEIVIDGAPERHAESREGQAA